MPVSLPLGPLNERFKVEDGTTLKSRRRLEAWLLQDAAIARLIWMDSAGNTVLRPQPTNASYRAGDRPQAEPEFPKPIQVADGWTTLSGDYRAPDDASKVLIELHFRWGEPHSAVDWTLPLFTKIDEPLKTSGPPRNGSLPTASGHDVQGKTGTVHPIHQRGEGKEG